MKPIDLSAKGGPASGGKKQIKKSTVGAGAVRIGKNINPVPVEAIHESPLRNDKRMPFVKLSRPRLNKKTIGLGFLIAIIVLIVSYFIFYRQTQESQAAECLSPSQWLVEPEAAYGP